MDRRTDENKTLKKESEMKIKKIVIADNSGIRRRKKVLHIWRNDITGMQPSSVVELQFVDDYTKCGCKKRNGHKYMVECIKFDDEYARNRGRHTVTLRRINENGTEQGDGE